MKGNEDKFNKQIGHNILCARLAKGFSIDQVSEHTKINPKTYWRYENGFNIPLKKLAIICYDLEVSMEDVVNKKAKIIIEFTK